MDKLTPAEYFHQAHGDFSPVGWHLGHMALIESQWILQHLAGQPCPVAPYRQLFAADGLPKAARQQLPELSLVLASLSTVRQAVWAYLDTAPLGPQLRLWLWLLQHESQHAETISIVLALHRRGSVIPSSNGQRLLTLKDSSAPTLNQPMVFLPATAITQGYDGMDGLDNEQPPQWVKVDAFWLDAHPVTQAQFQAFRQAGGYDNKALWSPAGWAWRQAAQVDRPLYWIEDGQGDHHPVCGVSCYEAEAYATFVGKRLPTETEWERAACWTTAGEGRRLYPWGDTWPHPNRGNFGRALGRTSPVGQYPAGQTDGGLLDLLGNVWEWTASWFEGYPGFRPFPYRGYSETYFDQRHRVLRGGSWATRPWALRGTLRNWYYPHVREIFAGFRCARDG